jgi:hypothetical protein
MIHTTFGEFALLPYLWFRIIQFALNIDLDASCPDNTATMVVVVVSEDLLKKNCISSRALQHFMYETFLWFLRRFAHNTFLLNPKL